MHSFPQLLYAKHLTSSCSFPQDAFDKLTVDSANQQASADAAAVTAADQNASFVEKAARQKASFLINICPLMPMSSPYYCYW